MPGEQHVSLAVLAGVANQRKRQSVLVRSAKLINAGTFAVLWSFAACALNCNGIPADCVGAPYITFAIMIPVDVKRAIGPHRPDGAE